MAQAQVIAKVSSLTGEAYARNAEGRLRRLKAGDEIREGESVVTADGAQVVLQLADGRQLTILPGDVVRIDAEVAAEFKPDATDSAVANDPIAFRDITEALARGEDLDALIEEPAAGNAGPGSEGHSFVEFARIIESVGSQSYQFPGEGSAAADTFDQGILGGEEVAAGVVSGGAGTGGAGSGGGTNAAPVANNDSLAATEDTPVTYTTAQLLGNDTDPENDTLAIASVTSGAGGTAVLNGDGTVTFTPNANFNGTADFTYTVTDGTLISNVATVTVAVATANDAPVTSDLSLTTDEDTPVNGAISASDVDGDSLSYVVSGNPGNGTVVLNPATGTFTYTPNANYNGGDSFVVTVSDGNGGTTTSTVSIGVNPINDAPVANNDSLAATEDTAVTYTAVQLLGNDTDPENDTLAIASVTSGAGGTAVLNGDGTVTFTPNANFNGTADFTYTVTDGTLTSNTATVAVNVAAVNDAPVANNDSLAATEDTAVTYTAAQLLGNDTDPENDTLAIASVTSGAGGTAVLNGDGTVTFTPNANFNGTADFTYTVTDGTLTSNTATVAVNVAAVNDAPVANNDSLAATEDTPVTYTAAQLLGNDTDPENVTLAIASVTSGAGGTAVLNGDGTVTFTPNANFNGTADFSYTVTDGTLISNVATVTVAVATANDAPVTSDLSLTTDEDTPVNGAISASDVDGDSLSYVVSGNPGNGTVVLNPATGTFTYTPNANYNGGDSFVVTVSDGNGGTTTSTVSIGVNPVNDAPVAANDLAVTDEGSPVTIAVRGNDSDVDGDAMTVAAVTQGVNGVVLIDPITGNPIYTPNSGFSGMDSFTYSISDGRGGSSSATVQVTVNDVNQPSVMSPESVTIDEDTFVWGNVLSNDSDVDDTLRVASFEINSAIYSVGANAIIPGVGDITIFSSGDYRFNPETNYHGPVPVITYTTNAGASSTLTLTVSPVNDQPDAVNDSLVTSEDQPLVISPATLLGNDSDIEGDSLMFVSAQSAVNGSVNIVGGNIVFTPAADYSGPASFSYTITDGNGGFDTATANITVNPVDDPSIMNPESVTIDEDTFVWGNVLSNDSDVDDTLRIASFEINSSIYSVGANAIIPGVGDITIFSSGDYRFNAAPNYNGPVPVITYTTNTGASSTLTLSVSPVNDLPSGTDNTVTIIEDGSKTFAAADFGYADIDGDAFASVRIDSLPAAGTLMLSGSPVSAGDVVAAANLGNLVFTPVANASGTGYASFTFSVNDGAGFDATPNTLMVNVTPDADTPTLTLTPKAYSVSTNLEESGVAGWSNVAVTSLNGGVWRTDNAGGIVEIGDASVYLGGSSTNQVIELEARSGDASNLYTTMAVKAGEVYSLSFESALRSGQSAANCSFSVLWNGQKVAEIAPGSTTLSPYNLTLLSEITGTGKLELRANDSSSVGAVLDNIVLQLTPATGFEDHPVNLPAVAAALADIDGSEILAVALSGVPNGATLSDGTNTVLATGADITITGWNLANLTLTPPANFNGSIPLNVIATATETANGDSAQVALPLNITVLPVNDAPTVANPIPDQNATEDAAFNYQFAANSFADVDAGDTLSYSAQLAGGGALPAWLSFDPVTRTFSGTPLNGDVGTLSIDVLANDGNGGTVTDTFNVVVANTNDAPTVANPIPNQNATEDAAFNYQFAANSFADEDVGDTLSYSAQLAGGGALPAWLSFDPVTRTFSGTPLNGDVGTLSIDVIANDGNGGTVTDTFNVVVANTNDAPTVANPIPDQNATEDAAFNYQFAANSFADVDVGDTLSYSAQLAGGGALPAWLSFDPVTRTFSGTPLNGDVGTLSIDVLANDGNGGTVTDTFNVVVANVNDAPTTTPVTLVAMLEDGTRIITAAELLANASDIENDALRVANLTASSGTLIDNGDGTWNFTPALNDDSGVTFTYDIVDNGSTNGVSDPQSTTASATLDIIAVADAVGSSGVVIGASYVFTVPNSGGSTYTAPNGITVTASGGTLVSNNGLGIGVQSEGKGDNRIDPGESLTFQFTDAASVHGISMNVKNSDGETVSIASTLDASGLNLSSVALAGTLQVVGKSTISATTASVILTIEGTLGTLSSTAVINANGTWSISGLDASSVGTVTQVSLQTSIDGDAFSNGGDLLNFTVSREIRSMVITDGALYGNKDGYQVDYLSFSPVPQKGNSYPVELFANLFDVDGSESFSAISLSGFPAGAALYVLDTDTGSLSAVPSSGFASDGSAIFMLDTAFLENAYTAGGFTDQLWLSTATSHLPANFVPTMTIVTQDSDGSEAYSILGGSNGNVLTGGIGNDMIDGGAGNDILIGGAGNDTLVGGSGVDVFRWSFSDQGSVELPAVDVIQQFDTASVAAGGDVLDLRDLLSGSATTASAIDQYLDFEKSGSNTIINVRPDTAGGVTQQIVLEGVDLTSGVTPVVGQSMDQAIIQNLLNSGKLITD